MPTLRLRIELNKGRVGIPIPKLADIADRTLQFLSMFCEDLGFDKEPRDWLALHFGNGSVEFDCQKSEAISEIELNRALAAIAAIMDNKDSDIGVHIRPATRIKYAGIAYSIDPDERVRFGIYSNGESTPAKWHELTRTLAGEIKEHIPQSAKYFGEVQGIVHSFYKEVRPPYLVIRELSTKALINCFFQEELYASAVSVMKEKDSVVFVEGDVTENLVEGTIESIQVKDFKLAPEFDPEKFEQFIGSKPNLTGDLSTEEFVEKFRSNA